MITPDRAIGLASLTASIVMYHKMTALTLLVGGPYLPMLGVVGAGFYGMAKFSTSPHISSISMINGDTVELKI